MLDNEIEYAPVASASTSPPFAALSAASSCDCEPMRIVLVPVLVVVVLPLVVPDVVGVGVGVGVGAGVGVDVGVGVGDEMTGSEIELPDVEEEVEPLVLVELVS